MAVVFVAAFAFLLLLHFDVLDAPIWVDYALALLLATDVVSLPWWLQRNIGAQPHALQRRQCHDCGKEAMSASTFTCAACGAEFRPARRA